MSTEGLKGWKSVTFAFSSFMGPLIKCQKLVVQLAKRNFTRLVFTNGFQPVKILPAPFVEIYFDHPIKI